MAEMLTIFDDEGTPKGTKEREKVHKDGDWHETFHCWFFKKENERVQLLFQQRSQDKKDFPGLFDITAAGHIGADENLVDAGLREIEEELGVQTNIEDLIYTGVYNEELTDKAIVDREICHVYLYPCPDSLLFQLGDEVQDVIQVPLEKVETLVEGTKETVHGYSLIHKNKREMKRVDMVPHEIDYERYIISSVSQYVEKL
ncbi:NUDIX hydrolase [Halobacillus litoralis]|uniref:NUDIX hydrolase n=1 Tax=Halobacillus litoralis TaxID=45668 RepID=UPI001CFE610B|nr:NUDIX domain-containing protein [Halobacillus litoralis]